MVSDKIPLDGFRDRSEGPLAGHWVIRNKLNHDAGYFQVKDPEDGVDMIVTFESERDARTFIARYDVTDGEPYFVPQLH
jgi:hypothetical protein